MNWDEAMGLIHGADWKHTKLGLDRMRELLHELGDPDRKLRFVHIAGTNGKGSACAMTAAILAAAGYKTGLYISPNVGAFNERIQINGEYISDKDLINIAARVKTAVEKLHEEPVDFELITAMAFLYFEEEHCDIVVLEVGMGGRLDATNVIDPPLVSAIMNIGLEHTAVLGNTLGKIAFEKAGIIKRGSEVILFHQTDEVENVVKNKFEEVNTGEDGNSFVITKSDCMKIISRNLDEQVFSYPVIREKPYRLALMGEYQAGNALVVLHIVEALKRQGVSISEAAVDTGLMNVRWPGRFELLNRDPVVIVDGAHNPNGVEALVRSIKTYFPDKKCIFVMGVMADKNYHDMVKLVTPLAESFITELPDNDRALSPEELKREIAKYFSGRVTVAESVSSAVRTAIELSEAAESKLPVICFGSLFQVEGVRHALAS